MRWMVLLFLLALVSPVHAGHTPPKIFLRVYIQTPGEGLPSEQVQPVTIPPNDEVIQIRALPEVTERDLVDIKSDSSGAVHLQFDHIGQVNLGAVTGQNQGRILVVMLNGFVVYAPIVDEQITTGELILPRPLKPEAIQLLRETAQQNVKEAARR